MDVIHVGCAGEGTIGLLHLINMNENIHVVEVIDLPEEDTLERLLLDANRTMKAEIKKVDCEIEKLREKEQCNKSTKYYKRRSKFYF